MSRRGGHKELGDPFTPEMRRPTRRSRAGDVCYYGLSFLMTLTILILVILLTCWVCDIYTDSTIIKDTVILIKECVDMLKEGTVMELSTLCNDNDPCTADFIKQGACMNLPQACGDGKGECPSIPCHDICYDDPLILRGDSLISEYKAARSEVYNGQCQLGSCVPSGACKGQCDPGLLVKRDNKGRQLSSCQQAGCPALSFKPGFNDNDEGCNCDNCNMCFWSVDIDLGLQPVNGTGIPIICKDTDLMIKKCMATIDDNEPHKPCLTASVAECDDIGLGKRDLEPRDFFPPAILRCRIQFACAEPTVQPFIFK